MHAMVCRIGASAAAAQQPQLTPRPTRKKWSPELNFRHLEIPTKTSFFWSNQVGGCPPWDRTQKKKFWSEFRCS
eukprot:SAG31_NODE_1581_length_7834_cov_11.737298_7_plen_74_part_00